VVRDDATSTGSAGHAPTADRLLRTRPEELACPTRHVADIVEKSVHSCAGRDRHSRATTAPVNARGCGEQLRPDHDSGIAAQLSGTKRPFAEAPTLVDRRAMSSWPVPVQPVMSTATWCRPACGGGSITDTAARRRRDSGRCCSRQARSSREVGGAIANKHSSRREPERLEDHVGEPGPHGRR